MSSRQTGSRYMDNGSSRTGYEHGVGNTGLQTPGLLSQLLGKDKVTGGLVTGPDGKLQYTPAQGSSGLFGAQSRVNAAILNQQLGSQVLNQQHEKELSAQQEKEQEALAQIQGDIQDKLGKSAQVNAIATKLGIPVDQLVGSLSQELAKNALQEQKNMGSALNNPDVQKSYSTGLIAGNEAQGAKNADLRKLVVPSGGIGIMPGLTGMQTPTVGYGATPRQNTVPNVMNFNGQPITVGTKTIQDYAPARASYPSLFDAAKNIQPSPGDASNPAPPADTQAQPNTQGPMSPGDYYNQIQKDSSPNQLQGLNVGNANDPLQQGASPQMSTDDIVKFYQQLMSQMQGAQP